MRLEANDQLVARARAIVDAQPEETWDGAAEVLRTAMRMGLGLLETGAGILTPNELSGGDRMVVSYESSDGEKLSLEEEARLDDSRTDDAERINDSIGGYVA